jgi:hypothetical protein
MKLARQSAVTTSMGILFKIGNSLENENISYNLFVKHFLVVPKNHSKAMAWADGFGFPGSQARPKPWSSRDFGLAHGLKPGRAHHYPPATQTQAHWQPYNAIQCLSAHSSPTGYLHAPASSVSSASPTPPQVLTVFKTLQLPHLLSLRPQGRYLFVMSIKQVCHWSCWW